MKEPKAPVFDIQINATAMTLRDYFAGLAMQQLIPIAAEQHFTKGVNISRLQTATKSYEMADAMLEARKV